MVRNSEQEIVKAIRSKGYNGLFWEKSNLVDLSQAISQTCLKGHSSLQVQTIVLLEESAPTGILCKFTFENTPLFGIRLNQIRIEQRNATQDAKLLVANTINIRRLSQIPSKETVIELINGPNLRVKKSRYRM